jgi:hypothetical protein
VVVIKTSAAEQVFYVMAVLFEKELALVGLFVYAHIANVSKPQRNECH